VKVAQFRVVFVQSLVEGDYMKKIQN